MKGQNWSAVVVEFLLVVLGVFLGIAAANWNEERLERRETRQLLGELHQELTDWVAYIDSLERYYEAVATYSDRAEAGWSDPSTVPDTDFVIAAYQASQVSAVANSAGVWSMIFGAANLRDIEDPTVRRDLATLMTFDYATVDLRSVATRYREEVRKTIPNEMQAQIRRECGDRAGQRGQYILPVQCTIELPAAKTRMAAAALRRRPELLAELHWHRAAVANQMAQAQFIRRTAASLTRRISPAKA